LRNLFLRPFRKVPDARRVEEASEDSTFGGTANELPEAQQRRWGFINGLKAVARRLFLFSHILPAHFREETDESCRIEMYSVDILIFVSWF
jgi:hypothetical protein